MCPGDAGGLLTIHGLLVGIATSSATQGCQKGIPDTIVNLVEFKARIESIIKKN